MYEASCYVKQYDTVFLNIKLFHQNYSSPINVTSCFEDCDNSCAECVGTATNCTECAKTKYLSPGDTMQEGRCS